MNLCRHCNAKKSTRPRGLCETCYRLPGLRKQYPTCRDYTPNDDPTDAELDSMIREQLADLPEWWDRARAYEPTPKTVSRPKMFSVVKGE